MDTITHGIAGALIGKALFRGGDMFGSHAGKEKNRSEDQAGREKNGSKDPPLQDVQRRIVTWALMLGAIFPDSDVIRDIFSHDKLLIVTWHRSITHSLFLLPLWALLLAALTRWFANRRKWPAPSLVVLVGIYAVGILSHILLDLVTTFGTMIWSPLEWSRPAWDMVFIVDFTLSGILLVPQMLAWVYSQPDKMRWRAIAMSLVFMPAPFVIGRLAETAGAPISDRTVLVTMILLAVIFLSPTAGGWGLRTRYITWNRAGLVAALG